MVAPNLELATQHYLNCLEKACDRPSDRNTQRYEWATAALIDQMVRKKSGGIMRQKLRQNDVDWDQIKQTNGDVFDDIHNRINTGLRHHKGATEKLKKYLPQSIGDINESTRKILYLLARRFYIKISKKSYVELINEKTLWMYDRFSLSELLKKTGFENIKVLDYKTSQLEFWNKYDFDRSEKGDYPLEPSVYVEGIKY
jgi:hypothetical protein